MRMRHASIEARGRVIATIQARKRTVGGMALLFWWLCLPKCIAPHAIPSRGSCLAMRCRCLVSLRWANLPADLLGFAWHDLPGDFRELA